MGKLCQLVMGPAGSGKSTYCSTIIQHAADSLRRSMNLVNLDPAAQHFAVTPTIDIRDLIGLEEVMEELEYGPNGGLIYCLEYLVRESMDWFEEALADFEEDYLIIDCPGQIEVYSHYTIMKELVAALHKLNYRVCGVYLLDSQFVEDPSKFFAGTLSAMSCMAQMEIPHINVLTKMDLLGERAASAIVERYLDVDPSLLLEDVNADARPRYHALTGALVGLIEQFNMVQFVPLNIREEESLTMVLMHIDHAIQYGEDLEPREAKDLELEGDDAEEGEDA